MQINSPELPELSTDRQRRQLYTAGVIDVVSAVSAVAALLIPDKIVSASAGVIFPALAACKFVNAVCNAVIVFVSVPSAVCRSVNVAIGCDLSRVINCEIRIC